jgi:hypothetical protein
VFFCRHGKFFLTVSFIDGLKLSIEFVPMDQWPSVREGLYHQLLILSIKNKKSLTNVLIKSMKMRPKVSIDTIGIYSSIHRRLCPAMLTSTTAVTPAPAPSCTNMADS